MDADDTVVSALAVRGDTIVFVGDDREARGMVGQETRVVDAGGRLVLPGFIESHIHLLFESACVTGLVFDEHDEVLDVQRKVAEYAAAHPEEPGIWGFNWRASMIDATCADLDEVVADRPVALLANDMHHAWGNTAAYEAAGITTATPDPPGARYERNEDGGPRGLAAENGATVPLIAGAGVLSDAFIGRGIKRTADGLAGLGVQHRLRCGQRVRTVARPAGRCEPRRPGRAPPATRGLLDRLGGGRSGRTARRGRRGVHQRARLGSHVEDPRRRERGQQDLPHVRGLSRGSGQQRGDPVQ